LPLLPCNVPAGALCNASKALDSRNSDGVF
jgi:hypothetical protein